MIQRVLETMHIPYLSKPQFEADDILATLSVQARAQGMQVLICTGDRDALQLVNDDVTVLYPVKGVSELARMTPGRGRGQVRRPAASATRTSRRSSGESSDNLPGIPGVGPKTAAKWIVQYDGLEGILAPRTRCRARRGSRCATTSTRCASTASSTRC